MKRESPTDKDRQTKPSFKRTSSSAQFNSILFNHFYAFEKGQPTEKKKKNKNSAGVHDFKTAGLICVNTSEWAITGLYSQVNVNNYFAALLQVRFNITAKFKNFFTNLS